MYRFPLCKRRVVKKNKNLFFKLSQRSADCKNFFFFFFLFSSLDDNAQSVLFASNNRKSLEKEEKGLAIVHDSSAERNKNLQPLPDPPSSQQHFSVLLCLSSFTRRQILLKLLCVYACLIKEDSTAQHRTAQRCSF